MRAMERTRYCRSRGSNALAFEEPRRDLQPASSTGFSSDDSIFDLQEQPDPREFAPFAASQRTRILTRVVAAGMVVPAFAILVAVFNSDVTRVLIDQARVSKGATRNQTETQAASNQSAARQILLDDNPARAANPGTPASVNTSPPRLGTASREDIVSNDRGAQQIQAPAGRSGNEGAAASKTLDPETLAALMTRAKSLLALGDIAAARLLLERAANARDATAAFLLAQTYDPGVLGVRDTRSITPDPVMARDWYRKAASLGLAEDQQRLTQLQI
jgi:hypothetical protein